jgi:hypothetical protein
VPAIDAATASDAAALNVLSSPLLVANRLAIVEGAARLRPAELLLNRPKTS